jgi:hypothetical protein
VVRQVVDQLANPGESPRLAVIPGQPGRPPTWAYAGCPLPERPVTKLLALPVTVWNRRRCLRLAQRGQCPSDKPVGDHGGLVGMAARVSPIRGSHVSGMKSSKQPVINRPAGLTARARPEAKPESARQTSARPGTYQEDEAVSGRTPTRAEATSGDLESQLPSVYGTSAEPAAGSPPGPRG